MVSIKMKVNGYSGVIERLDHRNLTLKNERRTFVKKNRFQSDLYRHTNPSAGFIQIFTLCAAQSKALIVEIPLKALVGIPIQEAYDKKKAIHVSLNLFDDDHPSIAAIDLNHVKVIDAIQVKQGDVYFLKAESTSWS